MERSKEELSSIAGLYPVSMLASLQDNPQRAAQLLESARAALETAGAHLESDTTRAASALDTAQRALVSDEDPLGALENPRGVELRMDAVLAPLMTQEEARRKAKETAQRHIRDADAALAWARKYLKDHEGSALLNVNKLLSEAEQAMTEAHKALDEDPLRASAAASKAATLINRALAAPGRR